MKIKQLAVTGFGPYASRQELDFEESLGDASMFVISGNTGAGKTTIFDAIAYALFGEASGTGRDGASLRSDFADASDPTEVELNFSLRGDAYRVRRSPAYERAKQRGKGTTKKDAEAELTLPGGKVRTGAKDVTSEIEEILGLTADQFRQLVMIPQGEFRRFLGADASHKEEIFRKIFGTEVYVRMQSIAKEKARRIADQSEQIRHDRRESVRKFILRDDDSGLEELIAAEEPDMNTLLERFRKSISRDKENYNELNAQISGKNELIEKLSREYSLGMSLNRDLDDLETRTKELTILESRRDEYNIKGESAVKARKALSVWIHEKSLLDKIKESESCEWMISSSKQKISVFEKRAADAETLFEMQKKRESERSSVINRISELETLKTKTDAIRKTEGEISRVEQTVESLKKKITYLEDATALNERENLEIETRLVEIAGMKDRKNSLEVESKILLGERLKISDLLTSIDQWLAEEKRYAGLAVHFHDIDAAFAALREECDLLERRFILNQAGILARGLSVGTPCPVCGSTDHPKKAMFEDDAVSEETLRLCRGEVEKTGNDRNSVINGLSSSKSKLETIFGNSILPSASDFVREPSCETISSLREKSAQDFSVAEKRIEAIGNDIRMLCEKIVEEPALVSRRDALRKKVTSQREESNGCRNEFAEKSTELGSLRTLLESLKTEFGGIVFTIDAIEGEIFARRAEFEKMKKEYDDAENALSNNRRILDSERGNLGALETRMKKIGEDRSEARKMYHEQLATSGFMDEEEYHASRIDEESLRRLEKEIGDYTVTFERTRALRAELAKKTEGSTKIDLAGIEGEISSQKTEREKLTTGMLAVNSRIRNNDRIVTECARFASLLKKTDEGYMTIGHVAKVLNGDNPRRISFERYVLAAYFDDIIRAANIRFGRMTGGRFELMRKTETGDKRKALGLEMEVYDNYTGHARGASTLSGGESFKASLCLALGMADVVQSHTGGIQLDTMFIDEGFGTLDPESLDTAIECLMELRHGGRLVGIISHVPELKERISARLEVTSTSRGSRAAFTA